MIIDQRIIFDQFKGYEKSYFLGGSANGGGNIAQANIKGLKIFEEGSYDEVNRADVWGIDDYDLFKEADDTLNFSIKKKENLLLPIFKQQQIICLLQFQKS